MLATMKMIAAYCHSPRSMVAIMSVAITPMPMNAPSIGFLSARESAIAPSIGPRIAMIATAIVVAQAYRAVATAGGRSAAATEAKKSGKTAVMTVD